VSYSVPPVALGQTVECRAALGEGLLEIRLAGRTIAVHHIALKGSGQIWDPEHRRATEAQALGRPVSAARRLRLVGDKQGPAGDYKVEAVDLSLYDLDREQR
jgi:hypothetical protein